MHKSFMYSQIDAETGALRVNPVPIDWMCEVQWAKQLAKQKTRRCAAMPHSEFEQLGKADSHSRDLTRSRSISF